ncbi:hypothetical protein A2721_02560 [Candidatus Gottesmanbacteria bacterium RIFCSPHIGHO2_01_FULL_47_48]|uniref:Addiction module toxin RelE n=1 Tax=Candidatus Gottesmanbacteria bacterium RIFCSPHIGHO2_01_FULL_47_48 TaxID=1798381 RepID=A0A1F6A412_9BACT|nr:MAG: hypothetical protein A2721_02560 [Candidatus Gottesmanbacteria bacterium RIFCSPHIGHO2_01_FULL_47_48]
MRLQFSKDALKQLEKISRNEAKKITRKLEQLETEPLVGKKLAGELADQFSLRAWPYRIIYQVYPKAQTVLIIHIEHRQGVYKN